MQQISNSADVIYGNEISVSYMEMDKWKAVWGEHELHMNEIGRCFRLFYMEAEFWGIYIVSAWSEACGYHHSAYIVIYYYLIHTHLLPVPVSGTPLLPATFLPEDMVAMTPGLARHSSLLHTYDPMKPKHTLKELLYSRPSTSGRIFNFKVYLHIYYSTSKSKGFFKKVIATSLCLWWRQFLLLIFPILLNFWILQKSSAF